MTEGMELLAQTIISGNLLLIQGLGLYALTRYTKSVKQAAKSGGITAGAMFIGSLVLWALNGVSFNSPSAQIGFYTLVGVCSAVAAQKLFNPEFSVEEGMFDSAVVGSLLLLCQNNVLGVDGIWTALGAGAGYFLALTVMATLRERLELAPVPKALQGTPIMLITAGLLAVALLGFRF
ncbi:MAG TPA: hypothetical protein GX528_02610 [Firmicutes bacterium]|nr:hypothetical protein [Bacillota bacterium]